MYLDYFLEKREVFFVLVNERINFDSHQSLMTCIYIFFVLLRLKLIALKALRGTVENVSLRSLCMGVVNWSTW